MTLLQLQTATPQEVGMDRVALASLRDQMAALVSDGRRAGIVYAVARHGRLVAHEAIGQRDLELGLPMTKDTVFRVYSMSRAITAAAALTLVEKGRLDLDDAVAKFIPEVADTPVIKTVVDGAVTETEPQTSPMTVRHLFTYTSGLGYGFDYPPSLRFEQDSVVPLGGTIAEGMMALARYPLLFQPGLRWHYGFSGDMLGRVIEVASGQPLDLYLQKTVFEPVVMPSAGFWIDGDRKDLLAKVYKTTPDNPLLQPTPAYPLSTYDHPGSFFSAGGGLVSTALDYLRFCQMMLNGGEIDGARVLKPETVAEMFSRQTTPEQGLVFHHWPDGGRNGIGAGYAWGLSIGVRVNDAPHTVPGSLGDVAWEGLANTFFFIDPTTQLVAVAMSQYVGPDEPALGRILRTGVYAALGEERPV